MKKSGSMQVEEDRCIFLNELCGKIADRIEMGAPTVATIKRAARRQRKALFKYGRLSWSTLRTFYYAWKRTPSPEVFRRHYLAAGHFHKKVPIALLVEFLDRLAGERIVPAATAIQTLRADWKMGRSIPGLGTWREFPRRQHGEAVTRATAPRFPFSKSTLYLQLCCGRPGEYQRRISAALRAQGELNRFTAYIEARRTALEAQRAHEPLGVPFSQQR
jgi:hypothetical protein